MRQTETINGITYIIGDDGNRYDMKTGKAVGLPTNMGGHNNDIDFSVTPEMLKPNPIGHQDGDPDSNPSQTWFPSPNNNVVKTGIVPVEKKANTVWDGKPYEGRDYAFDPSMRGIMGAKDDKGRQTHRGFLGGILGGAKELFNDPKRMALITGGLRMADPNSYYDAQGFYSPWGGINAGLGTGIKTYKSLSEPTYKAKQKILHDNAKELATHEAQLKSEYGIDSKEWATWLQYKKMLPLNKQNDPNEYLKWKRSVPWLNRGSEFIQPPSTDVNNAKPRTIPKDLSPSEQPIHKQEVETHKAIGAGLGDDIASARSKLPMMELELAEMETLADEFINHAGFSDLIGATWKPFAKNIHGTDAAGADSIRKQLEGKLFMKAYQTLKGGGQITEIEGDQAKQAQGRMNIALSEKEYKKALTDFLDAYRRGLEKLKGVAYPVGTNPQRRKGDSKSRRSTDNLTEEETREMETLKLELGK